MALSSSLDHLQPQLKTSIRTDLLITRRSRRSLSSGRFFRRRSAPTVSSALRASSPAKVFDRIMSSASVTSSTFTAPNTVTMPSGSYFTMFRCRKSVTNLRRRHALLISALRTSASSLATLSAAGAGAAFCAAFPPAFFPAFFPTLPSVLVRAGRLRSSAAASHSPAGPSSAATERP